MSDNIITVEGTDFTQSQVSFEVNFEDIDVNSPAVSMEHLLLQEIKKLHLRLEKLRCGDKENSSRYDRAYIDKLFKYTDVARSYAMLSEDKSHRISAIAFDDKCNIIGTGYNGLPRGVEHREERLQKPLKSEYTVHAEENLVAQAAYRGQSLKDSSVMVTGRFPCAPCARKLIQAGVRLVLAPYPIDGNYLESNRIARQMFEEAGVEIHMNDALSSEVLGLDVEEPEDIVGPGIYEDTGTSDMIGKWYK